MSEKNMITLYSSMKKTLSELISGIEDGSVAMHMGDSFTCALSNGQDVTFTVTDENETSLRFEMKELLKTISRTEVDAWYKELFSMLPEELQRAIIPTKRRYMDGNGELKEFEALLFMPSASEVFPAEDCPDWCWMGDKGVYRQMDYYKDAANRVRCRAEDGLPNNWWLISVCFENSEYFTIVRSDGISGIADGSNEIAAPVCFRIRKAKNAG